jgi:hypothetical protein
MNNPELIPPKELIHKISHEAADAFPENDYEDLNDTYNKRDQYLADYFAKWGANQPLPKPDLSSLNHEGTVTRVLPDGYVYVVESGPNRRKYIVSFSRSVPNYRGETARELRLSRGTKVRFSRNGNEVQRIAVGPNYEEFLRNR